MSLKSYISSAPSSSAPASALTRTTTTVHTNVGTKQALLPAVPVGKKRIVTQVVTRNASASLAAYDSGGDGLSFGFSAGGTNWAGVLPAGAIPNFTDNTVAAQIVAAADLNNTFIAGAAGDIFGCVFGDTSITATLDIDVFYYDV